MRARGRTIISTLITVAVVAAAALYFLASAGLEERSFACRGHATSPASSEMMPADGRLQISEYAAFVQMLAGLLRDDMVGEADAVFISGLTGAVAEQQIAVSGEPGHRRYSDFSRHRQFDFDEATGQLVIEQAGIVFQGSCLPASS
jgi:hypothetical protein